MILADNNSLRPHAIANSTAAHRTSLITEEVETIDRQFCCDVADSAMFLLSSAGRAITGEVLMVDAGFHAMGM